jgi:tetratricopeptide (TPR) repeat protein
MGYVLHLQGNLENALRLCKLALRIRRDLFKQGKIGEFDVGLSFSTLGHIYHTLGEINEEEKAYKAAFDIYYRVGNKDGIASAYNNLGRVWVKKGDLSKAHESFQQALRIALGVYRPVEIESYNQLGRLALRQEQWEEAIAHLQQAVALARRVGMNFELAENLLYLAQALDSFGQPSQALIQEAKRIARKNNFSYLLARAGEIQGDMCLRRQEYLSTFRHYGISCRHIAERSSLEFDRTLRKLNDNLLEIPGDYLPGAIDVLRSYWSEEGLDEKYPQLPAVCKEVSRHMLL